MSMERPSGELHLETSLGKASEVRGRLKPRDEDGWRGQIYIRVQVQVSRSKQNMSNCAPSCKQQPARYRFLQLQRRNHRHNLLNGLLVPPKTNPTSVSSQSKGSVPDWEHNRKRMLKLGITLLLYLNTGHILLRVRSGRLTTPPVM